MYCIHSPPKIAQRNLLLLAAKNANFGICQQKLQDFWGAAQKKAFPTTNGVWAQCGLIPRFFGRLRAFDGGWG